MEDIKTINELDIVDIRQRNIEVISNALLGKDDWAVEKFIQLLLTKINFFNEDGQRVRMDGESIRLNEEDNIEMYFDDEIHGRIIRIDINVKEALSDIKYPKCIGIFENSLEEENEESEFKSFIFYITKIIYEIISIYELDKLLEV